MTTEEHGTTYELAVDWTTLNRLKTRGLMNNDGTYDEVLTRLLNQTMNSISLSEFADRVLESMDVAQIALEKEPIQHGGNRLPFVLHTYDDLNGLFNGIHAIEVGGTTYRFKIRTSTMGPQDWRRITIYASDNILGMEPTSTEEGVEEVEKWVREQ